jgi:C-terminal processing protease CtpA/Prc
MRIVKQFGRNSLIFAMLALFAAATAAAPQEPVRVRAVSTLEAQVERLARELEMQRRLESEMMRTYAQLVTSARDSGVSQRAGNEGAARAIFERLTATASEVSRLKRELQTLCNSDQKPQGYLGVVLNGKVTVTREGDGPDVFMYHGNQVVESVEPGSPASKSGLRTGDVIIAMGGQELRAGDVSAAELLRPGARLPVQYERDGAARSVMVLVERRPDGYGMMCPWMDATIATAMSPVPNEFYLQIATADSSSDTPVRRYVFPAPAPSPSTARASAGPNTVYLGPFVAQFASGTNTVAGAQLVQMNRGLGETFGVDHGLLVLKVLPGAPAAKSGFHEGDVLLTVDDQDLTSPLVLQRAMVLSSDHEVKLVIVRKKARRNMTLKW